MTELVKSTSPAALVAAAVPLQVHHRVATEVRWGRGGAGAEVGAGAGTAGIPEVEAVETITTGTWVKTEHQNESLPGNAIAERRRQQGLENINICCKVEPNIVLAVLLALEVAEWRLAWMRCKT